MNDRLLKKIADIMMGQSNHIDEFFAATTAEKILQAILSDPNIVEIDRKAEPPKYEDYLPLAGDNKDTHYLVKMAFQMAIDACKAEGFVKKAKAGRAKMK